MHKYARILLWSSNVWALGEGLLGPLFAVFTQHIGGDILNISGAWATYLIVTGTGMILIGKWSDSVGKRRLLVFGYTLNAIFTFGYLLVSDPIHLFIVQAGLGIAFACTEPTWYALYDKYSGDGREDGKVWGLANGMYYIFSAIALLAGGLVIKHLSFTHLFIFMGILQTIAASITVPFLFKKNGVEKTN